MTRAEHSHAEAGARLAAPSRGPLPSEEAGV